MKKSSFVQDIGLLSLVSTVSLCESWDNLLRIDQDIDENVQFWLKHTPCYPLFWSDKKINPTLSRFQGSLLFLALMFCFSQLLICLFLVFMFLLALIYDCS